MDKKKLIEMDIITKCILPAVEDAGWYRMSQLRQEAKLRDGKVIVCGQMGMRKTLRAADMVLYYKPNLPLADIKAKANNHAVSKGIQQGTRLRPSAGCALYIRQQRLWLYLPRRNQALRIGNRSHIGGFPLTRGILAKILQPDWKGYTEAQTSIIKQPYYDDGSVIKVLRLFSC